MPYDCIKDGAPVVILSKDINPHTGPLIACGIFMTCARALIAVGHFSVVDDRDSIKARRIADVCLCLCGGRRAVGKFRGDRRGATATDVDPETNRNTEERGQRRRGVVRAIMVKTVEVAPLHIVEKTVRILVLQVNAEEDLCEQQCDSRNV